MKDEKQSTLTGDLRHSNYWGMEGFTRGLFFSHAQYAPQEDFTAKENPAPHSSQKQK